MSIVKYPEKAIFKKLNQKIKIIVKWLFWSDHDNEIRSSRFVFIDDQREALIENDGEYIFLVHNRCIQILYLRIPAHLV